MDRCRDQRDVPQRMLAYIIGGGKDFIQKSGGNVSPEKIPMMHDALIKRNGGFNTQHLVFLKRASHSSNRFLASVPPGNQLGENGIVVDRHFKAFINSG